VFESDPVVVKEEESEPEPTMASMNVHTLTKMNCFCLSVPSKTKTNFIVDSVWRLQFQKMDPSIRVM
jgi:hypothetical protein